MRRDLVSGLRGALRERMAENRLGTMGTLERTSVPTKVPTRSNREFQHESPAVPTVPTVPTHIAEGKREDGFLPPNDVGTAVGTELERPRFDALELDAAEPVSASPGPAPDREGEVVVMDIPAGPDPWATAGELISMAWERATRDRRYKFVLDDGRARPDPRCACGAIATFARLAPAPQFRDGRRWQCRECFDAEGEVCFQQETASEAIGDGALA